VRLIPEIFPVAGCGLGEVVNRFDDRFGLTPAIAFTLD